MKMSAVLSRIVRWHSPDETRERIRRTEAQHARAIAIRVRSEEVDRRLRATRRSYERASERMHRNGGHA